MEIIKYPCIYYTTKRHIKPMFSDILVYQQTLIIISMISILHNTLMKIDAENAKKTLKVVLLLI